MWDDPQDDSRAVRPYRSPLREQQAEATRTRVCQAAAPLFADRGYTRTSVRQLAAAAGVAVETVYAVGGKAAVFLRSFELAFSGTAHGASLLDLAELTPAWAATTLDEVVEGMTTFIVDSNERSAGLWSAYVEAANSDAALAAAYATRMRAMRVDGRRILAALVDRGLCALPPDPDRTVDAVWVALHPSQHVLLVTHAGWSRADYHDWVFSTVLRLLS
jgi:AcrR family transcriptional regulator